MLISFTTLLATLSSISRSRAASQPFSRYAYRQLGRYPCTVAVLFVIKPLSPAAGGKMPRAVSILAGHEVADASGAEYKEFQELVGYGSISARSYNRVFRGE